MGRDRSTCLYLGNLPPDVRQRDVEDLFHKYGRIKFCDVKNRTQRGGISFGFIEFEDARDAEDALRGRDGYEFDGYRIRVEETRGAGPRGPGGKPLHGPDDRRGHRRGGPRRRGHRIYVTGLPPTGSWQDLKDHMRSVGEIVCADVNRDGSGIVEFARYDDAKYAIKKMDDTKFTSHEGETAYIRVSDEGPRRSRSRSRSARRSPPRRSPAYSDRSVSRSRSRSRS